MLTKIREYRKLLLIGSGVFLISLLVVLIIFSLPKEEKRSTPASEPTPSKTITVVESKPWTSKLPLKNPYYYVEYSAERERIIAYLYPYFSLSIPPEAQVPDMKKEIIEKLGQLGVDTNKEKIEWVVKNPTN